MAGQAEVGALRIRLAMDAGEFEEGTKDATSSLNKLALRFGITAGIAASAGAAIGDAIGAAMQSVVTGLQAGIDRVKAFGDAADDVGVPVQSLAAIATQSIVSIDELSKGIKSLNEAMLDIASGDLTSKAARSFAALGVTVTDLTGNLRPAEDVLEDIAAKFALYEEGAQKTALANNIFGASGAALLPILDRGRDFLMQFRAEAVEAGQAIDTVTVQAAQRLQENVDKLGKNFETFSNKLAIAVLPTLDRLMQSLVDTTDKFNFADVAVATLAAGLKTLVSAGIIVQTVFTEMGNAILAAGNIMNSWFRGDITGAIEKFRAAGESTMSNLKEAIADVNTVWSAWQTSMEDSAKEHPDKVAAPLIASVKSISDAQKEWNKSVADGVALADKLRTPYEILARSLDNLGDAYDAGKISAESLGRAQFAASMVAQNAYAGMASNVAGSLEKVFANSKGVAIASALINTYEAATKALAAYPPPFNYVAAAATVAAGMAQVANIRSTSKGSGGGGGGGGDGGAAVMAPAAPTQSQSLFVQGIEPGQMFSGAAMRDLAEQLLQFQRDGGTVILA